MTQLTTALLGTLLHANQPETQRPVSGLLGRPLVAAEHFASDCIAGAAGLDESLLDNVCCGCAGSPNRRAQEHLGTYCRAWDSTDTLREKERGEERKKERARDKQATFQSGRGCRLLHLGNCQFGSCEYHNGQKRVPVLNLTTLPLDRAQHLSISPSTSTSTSFSTSFST